jgi:hypothetical protein
LAASFRIGHIDAGLYTAEYPFQAFIRYFNDLKATIIPQSCASVPGSSQLNDLTRWISVAGKKTQKLDLYLGRALLGRLETP